MTNLKYQSPIDDPQMQIPKNVRIFFRLKPFILKKKLKTKKDEIK